MVTSIILVCPEFPLWWFYWFRSFQRKIWCLQEDFDCFNLVLWLTLITQQSACMRLLLKAWTANMNNTDNTYYYALGQFYQHWMADCCFPLASFKLLITECAVCVRPTAKDQSTTDPHNGNHRKFSSTNWNSHPYLDETGTTPWEFHSSLSWYGIYLTVTHAIITETLFPRFKASSKSCIPYGTLVYTCTR